MVLRDYLLDNILRDNSGNNLELQPVQFLFLALDLLSLQFIHLLERDPAQQVRAVHPNPIPGFEHPVLEAAPLAGDHAE